MSVLRRLFPLLLLLAVLALGMTVLFRMRLGAGDLYPEYSSFRADPLGTRLLHDSLSALPGLKVERSLEPLARIADVRAPRTLILAGMTPGRWAGLSDEALNALDEAVRSGSRLVVVFEASTLYGRPRRMPYDTKFQIPGRKKGQQAEVDEESEDEDEEAGDGREASKDGKSEGKSGPAPVHRKAGDKHGEPDKAKSEQAGDDHTDDGDFERGDPHSRPKDRGWAGVDLVKQLWGVDLWGRGLVFRGNDDGATLAAGAPGTFPAHIRWKSCTYFVLSKGAPWTVLYERSPLPVMIEMRHGSGSIVMATDSYFLSNEALQEDPPVELLSWLVGSARTVVFEEAHLGVSKDKGVATLARRYGLMPAAALLLLAGLLYVWKEGVRFIPPAEEHDEVALEFHPTAGLEALLRRAIPRASLFEACRAEWKKHARRTDVARIEPISGGGAAAYNAAVRALRRHGAKPPLNTTPPPSS